MSLEICLSWIPVALFAGWHRAHVKVLSLSTVGLDMSTETVALGIRLATLLTLKAIAVNLISRRYRRGHVVRLVPGMSGIWYGRIRNVVVGRVGVVS